jgi:ribose transport system substrate-binding protein
LIPIVSKCLDILEQLENHHEPQTLEEIFRVTQISKTSVYRILKTLVHRGYVSQAQNGQYRLAARPRRLRFGFAAQSAEMPFSVAVTHSIKAAAAAAGVELLLLDNRYDPTMAVQNAEECVKMRVDLMLEFQIEEAVAPRIAHIFKKADIPLIAIDVPHPNATYFGVDNFESGYEAGTLLAQYALSKWKGNADWVLGIGFGEAGTFVQSRITGAFDSISEKLPGIPADRYLQIEGRGMRDASRIAFSEFLRDKPMRKRMLIAASTDSSALGVLDAIRESKREQDCAIVGQDCIPEVIAELQSGKGALIGSISHEADSYGPRLIQLGISLLRGYTTPPYNYVHHRVVTPDTVRT